LPFQKKKKRGWLVAFALPVCSDRAVAYEYGLYARSHLDSEVFQMISFSNQQLSISLSISAGGPSGSLIKSKEVPFWEKEGEII
jgi:hypothetical protein